MTERLPGAGILRHPGRAGRSQPRQRTRYVICRDVRQTGIQLAGAVRKASRAGMQFADLIVESSCGFAGFSGTVAQFGIPFRQENIVS